MMNFGAVVVYKTRIPATSQFASFPLVETREMNQTCLLTGSLVLYTTTVIYMVIYIDIDIDIGI